MRRTLISLSLLAVGTVGCTSTPQPTRIARIRRRPPAPRPVPRRQPQSLHPPAWHRPQLPAPAVEHTPAEWRPRQLSSRWKAIVIHHSATPNGGAKTFDKSHRGRGWDELGYHFVIGNGTETPDGQVEVGSRWSKQKHGAHCKTPDNYYNDHGIGICLVGDFTKTHPTPRQMAALGRLARYLSRSCRIPTGAITTHRDVTGKTACPGHNFPIDRVRRLAAASIVPAPAFARVRGGETGLLVGSAMRTARQGR